MAEMDRKLIRTAFNDPTDPVRVLIATDAASEGLNLQETARLLLHFEVPWNPSRLEQRNGRLDRHGQARDVTVFHFTSDDDADLRFLARVVQKVDQIREDLGTLGEVFDAAFQRRFTDLDDAERVADEMDRTVGLQRDEMQVPVDEPQADGAEQARIEQLCQNVDLSPATLRETLEVALGLDVGQPRLEGPDARGRFRLAQPIPARWQPLVDDSLRLPLDGSRLAGSIPSLVFNADHFVEERLGRPVFRPAKDTVLLHLGHPMLRQALGDFARLRFPGAIDRVAASRWTVRRTSVPEQHEAMIAITTEELAVNALREPFHHWVRTIRIPVQGDSLGSPLPYVPPGNQPSQPYEPTTADVEEAREIWQSVGYDVRDVLAERRQHVAARIESGLEAQKDNAIDTANENYENRIAEVRESMKKESIKRIQQERDKLLARKKQSYLFEDMNRDVELRLQDLDEELKRRNQHTEELLVSLAEEKARITQHLLPKRFTLRDGGVQVFPLTIEIQLPEVTS
jgi:hypothetical protein